MEANLKEKLARIYYLSKEKRKADSVGCNSIVEPKMRQTIIDQWNKVVVSGLDPGVVSTAVLTSSKFESLYEGINRYQVFSESDVQSDASIGEPYLPVSNFIGSWNRITTGMKGHTRIKLKPLLDRMKSIRHDSTLVVDEHNTTVTRSSCFGPI
ncbi:hypothetical protein K501DRAFT_279229 [Backusella circina FSU 941]|nr:hypothetical protein K501DRAFT_279229 [Backusella circina FSU 941]